MRTSYRLTRVSGALTAMAAALLLAGCGSSTSTSNATPTPPPPTPPANAMFEVTLVNLTAGQPLSPMVAAVHGDGFAIFNLGESASVALEHLAEGGETAPLLALATASPAVFASAAATGGPLLPGPDNKAVVMLTAPASSLPTLRLSTASMLGNTNDGFTGVSGQSLATLAVGASVSTRLVGYDAGTERNTETADTVPGPATAGSGGKREAFNAVRDDVNTVVHVHPGVVSKDDGLPTSALTLAQRWDNPVAVLTVKRIQ